MTETEPGLKILQFLGPVSESMGNISHGKFLKKKFPMGFPLENQWVNGISHGKSNYPLVFQWLKLFPMGKNYFPREKNFPMGFLFPMGNLWVIL